MAPGPNHEDKDDSSELDPGPGPESGRGEVEDRAESKDCEPKRWQVVVQEELSLHEEEGEIV